ncbi:MAG: hypothetical protein AAGA93_06145 [Actinomycetota bacterium]
MVDSSNAAIWAAWGVWATAAIYVGLGYFAWRQIRESRRARQVAVRPIVTVEPTFQNILVHYSVRNVGSTQAYNVSIAPNHAIRSGPPKGCDWSDSALFLPSGMPMLGPGREIRFYLGSYDELSDVGMTRMTGSLSYRSLDGVGYDESYDIDLAVYQHARIEQAALPELVAEVEKIGKALGDATRELKAIRRHLDPPSPPDRTALAEPMTQAD